MPRDVSVHKVLVPLDFAHAPEEHGGGEERFLVEEQWLEVAPGAVEALLRAAAIARGVGGELVLLHAIPAMNEAAAYTGPLTVPTGIIDDIHQRAKRVSLQIIQQLHHRRCPDLGMDVVVRPGPPDEVIVDEAEKRGIDLIVMATSGRSRLSRFFLGSTADRVIRTAPCPVMVVPHPKAGSEPVQD